LKHKALNPLLFSIAAVLLLFQNCSGKFEAINQVAELSTGSGGSSLLEGEIVPNGIAPNLVPNCLANPNYNTCVFWKNPIAQEGRVFASPVGGSSDLRSLQTHAVNIQPEHLDNSGFLQNSSLRVNAQLADGTILPRVDARTRVFKFAYGSDPAHKFSQIMAFYWLNFQIDFMQKHTGNFYAKNKNILVVSYYPERPEAFWFYGGDQKFIFMGSNNAGNELALSAEVYLHEMGHANLGYATNFTHYETSSAQSKSQICADRENTCCKSPLGCASAIDEGQADYHFAIIFPQNTAVLETFGNSVDGISECGITRTVSKNSGLTLQGAYDSCGNSARGEIHLMGRVYASIWWEVRRQAALVNLGDIKTLDTMFTEHLKLISSTDDFSSMLTKIKAIDASLFNSKFSALFEIEFARRGITQ